MKKFFIITLLAAAVMVGFGPGMSDAWAYRGHHGHHGYYGHGHHGHHWHHWHHGHYWR